MPDFKAHVRRNLPALGVSGERAAKVVDELAIQLEEHYVALLQEGATEEEAWKEVQRQIPSWQELAHDLAAAVPRHAPHRGRSDHRVLRRLRALVAVGVLRDIRSSAALLWKDRGFTATATVTLAVCLAANTSIFTVVNSVLLHALRVPEPERVLVMANQYRLAEPKIATTSATPDYFDRLQHLTVFEEQAMYAVAGEAMPIDGVPARITGMSATPSLFRLLRIPPAHGRTFSESEGERGNENKVVFSYGLWQELYGGDPGIVGREIRLTGRPFTVVGIMPREFAFGGPETRFWIPLVFSDRQKSDDARHSSGWFNIGRLKAGATIEQAREQLRILDAANLERFPHFKSVLANAGFESSVEPLQDALVRTTKDRLYLLWGGAVFVLLIGCVNLANLTLARAHLRVKDLATRLAIGASRPHLVRQLILEGLLLASIGGLAGMGLALWIVPALKTIGWAPVAGEIQMDGTVIGVAVIAVAVIGALIGAVSALPLWTLNVSAVLQEETRTGTSARKARTARRTLIVAQVACSFVLLVGAGLLLVSFRNLLAVDPGFRTEGIVTASTSLRPPRYATDDHARVFVERALGAIRGIPGVVTAGATTVVPMGANYNSGVIMAEGHVPKPGESIVSGVRALVTPGYFETIGTPLVRGRYFEERDNSATAGVIIIDERLARRFWPDGDPVGKRMYRPANPSEVLRVDANTRWLTVIGVVREAQLRGLTMDTFGGVYYLPYWPLPPRDYGFVIRTERDPAAVMSVVRAALAKIDPELPLFDIRTMAERADVSLMPRKSAMIMATFFAGVAMFLSAVGIYGVLAYLVAQRTREMGIRLVLGSTPRGIFGLVLREGLVLVAGGIVVGLAGAVALRGVLTTQLYGVGPTDPGVTILAVMLLGLVALAACVYPARRATRIDPVGVLNAR